MRNFKIFLFLITYFILFPCLSSSALAVTKNFWNDNLTNNIVINPFQGLGVCHWASPTLLEDPSVTWTYDSSEGTWWDRIEPAENQFNWEPMDNLVKLAKEKGKKIWLQVYNDGYVPQWALEKVVSGEKIILMGTANNPNNPCNSMNPRLPLPWNKAYLALWRKVIHKMAERYDNDPTVEAIVMMAGGGYGEMVVCSTCGPPACWAYFAGCGSGDEACVDQKFIQAVKDIVDLYLEKEHVWGNEGVLPAGTKTHGFVKKPVILQLGSGVYHHTTTVIKPVLDYVIPKYGMRVLLKSNGWHCGSCDTPQTPCDWGHGGVAQEYITSSNPSTKYGLEPGFPSADFTTTQKMMECCSGVSYACLQPFYWEGERRGGFSSLRGELARSLGTKVALKEITYPESVVAGQAYNFSLILKNLGGVPPFRPKRQEVAGVPKDITGSYQLTFQFVKNGVVSGHTEVDPNPPTTTWTQNQEISISSSIIIPASLSSGTYELRVALFDPEAKQKFRQEYFRFLNKDIQDIEGRTKIGDITVQGISPSPSPTPTQLPINLNLKAKFGGATEDQNFLVKILVTGSNFFDQIMMKDNTIYQNLLLEGLSLDRDQPYEFILSAFPFLSTKKSLTIKEGANPKNSPALDFEELKTGDLNGDNQINGLDWSLMKTNFGERGEE